jgi:ribosomal protein S18 acetylase RimI-like enzyme
VADDLSDLPPTVGLRPAGTDDRAFLIAVYASTRAEELSVVPWTDGERSAFLEAQFEAQDAHYRQVYPDARYLVIERDAEPIGRLSLADLKDELRIIDLALLPAHRGQGIGAALLAVVLERADREDRAVTLHVEPWNPAKRLYERFGFERVETRGIYEFMRRPQVSQLKTAS